MLRRVEAARRSAAERLEAKELDYRGDRAEQVGRNILEVVVSVADEPAASGEQLDVPVRAPRRARSVDQGTFESGDEPLSVRTFRVEEGLNALFTVAITARSIDPDLERASFVGQAAGFFLVGGMGRERSWTGISTRWGRSCPRTGVLTGSADTRRSSRARAPR